MDRHRHPDALHRFCRTLSGTNPFPALGLLGHHRGPHQCRAVVGGNQARRSHVGTLAEGKHPPKRPLGAYEAGRVILCHRADRGSLDPLCADARRSGAHCLAPGDQGGPQLFEGHRRFHCRCRLRGTSLFGGRSTDHGRPCIADDLFLLRIHASAHVDMRLSRRPEPDGNI